MGTTLKIESLFERILMGKNSMEAWNYPINTPLTWPIAPSKKGQSGGTVDWPFMLHTYPYALSFYGSKIILDHPNQFGWVPIVLDGPNLFWSGPNHFGQIQIIKISPEKSNVNLTKMIWIWPKWFGTEQNNLDGPKSFWTYKRTRY